MFIREFIALSSHVTRIELYTAKLTVVVGVDAGIILEVYVPVKRDLLRVPRYPRSTTDPVDIDIIPSMLLPG